MQDAVWQPSKYVQEGVGETRLQVRDVGAVENGFQCWEEGDVNPWSSCLGDVSR